MYKNNVISQMPSSEKVTYISSSSVLLLSQCIKGFRKPSVISTEPRELYLVTNVLC